MSTGASAAAGDTIADRYRIVRPLGEGGMSTVYLARHTLTGRTVALKLVSEADPVMRERLLREARSMGRLQHPNVVGVLDVGEWGGSVFLVMEYVHGRNLREHLGRRRATPAEAVDLLLPACSGVAAAHQASILHRDLKPENLFVCTDHGGEAFDTKVLDFGVAKHMGEGPGHSTLTDSGSLVGTPKYMAPEQIGDNPVLDERTDVYALGLILYEMLAGTLPYQSTGLRNIVLEILKGNLRPLQEMASDVPVELSDIVMCALSADPDARYTSVAEFAQALEPWADRAKFVPPRDVHTRRPTAESVRPPSLTGTIALDEAVDTAVSPNSPLHSPIVAPPTPERLADTVVTPRSEPAPAPHRSPARTGLLLVVLLAAIVAVWSLIAREAPQSPASTEPPRELPPAEIESAVPAPAPVPQAAGNEPHVDQDVDPDLDPSVELEVDSTKARSPFEAATAEPKGPEAAEQEAPPAMHKPAPAPKPAAAKVRRRARPAPNPEDDDPSYPPTDNRDPWATRPIEETSP